jgi:hypothetical protein
LIWEPYGHIVSVQVLVGYCTEIKELAGFIFNRAEKHINKT